MIALVAAAAVGVGACGDDEDDAPMESAIPAAPATTPTTPTTGTSTSSSASGSVSTDTSTKPEIPEPSGDPPTELEAEDIVAGEGRAVQAGDQLVVNYVGVLFETGEQFDASWDSGQTFPFTLGQGNVIPGWDQGLEGMKVGGRRQLTIPPDLAYGDQGQGSIPPGATLVFVVDLLNATPASG
ncbi:MAG: FKBP-type peptidyl-prolyl cis-trans isomerase [Solirubrobacteraceae bacterium]|nr:FKBP-type peptidyl-prolyl cis-trans isomerase [Solirubrobacteraceae bacterium]